MTVEQVVAAAVSVDDVLREARILGLDLVEAPIPRQFEKFRYRFMHGGRVYLLAQDDLALYVGSTSYGINSRVRCHRDDGRKFNRVLWCELPSREEATFAESWLIWFCKPPQNIKGRDVLWLDSTFDRARAEMLRGATP